MGVYIAILVIVICLLFILSFFSAIETAINSINILRINTMVQKGAISKKIINRIKLLQELLKRYTITISALSIINNFLTLTASTLSAIFFEHIFVSKVTGTYVSWFVLTIIIIIFCEIIPKYIGRNWPEFVTLKCLKILLFIYHIFYPFLKIVDSILKIRERIYATKAELKTIMTRVYEEGYLNKQEYLLLKNVLSLNESKVKEYYLKKQDVHFLYENVKANEIKTIYEQLMISNLPIIKKSNQKVIGMVNVKKFYINLIKNNNDKLNVQNYIENLPLIRLESNINNAYSVISINKNKCAFVVDNYINKKFLGILFLFNITDQFFNKNFKYSLKTSNYIYRKISNDKYLVNGNCPTKFICNNILGIEKLSKNINKSINKFLYILNDNQRLDMYEPIFYNEFLFRKVSEHNNNIIFEISKINIITPKNLKL